jgi:hypothetical protein
MSEMLKYDSERGVFDRIIRNDAVKLRKPERWFVPTSERTKWVSTWDEFLAAGGIASFSEDGTQMELLLPEPYKFSIQFIKESSNGQGD